MVYHSIDLIQINTTIIFLVKSFIFTDVVGLQSEKKAKRGTKEPR